MNELNFRLLVEKALEYYADSGEEDENITITEIYSINSGMLVVIVNGQEFGITVNEL